MPPVDQLARSPADILKTTEHDDYPLAVPTPDHFIPLLYLAGAADGDPVNALMRGYAMGSISMTCYGAGIDVEAARAPSDAATLPTGVPPEQTNV